MIVAECRGPAEMPIYHERTYCWHEQANWSYATACVPIRMVSSARRSGTRNTSFERDSRDGVAWAVTGITDFVGGNGMEAVQSEAHLLIVESVRCGAVRSSGPDENRKHTVRQDMDIIPLGTRRCFRMPTSPVSALPEKATRSRLRKRRVDDSHARYGVERAARLAPATPFASASGACAVDVCGHLLVFNDGIETAHGIWGSTDAANLWADSDGVFAHRAKRIDLRQQGIARIRVESDNVPVDLI